MRALPALRWAGSEHFSIMQSGEDVRCVTEAQGVQSGSVVAKERHLESPRRGEASNRQHDPAGPLVAGKHVLGVRPALSHGGRTPPTSTGVQRRGPAAGAFATRSIPCASRPPGPAVPGPAAAVRCWFMGLWSRQRTPCVCRLEPAVRHRFDVARGRRGCGFTGFWSSRALADRGVQ